MTHWHKTLMNASESRMYTNKTGENNLWEQLQTL